ncbi:MAG: ATP phosphoribosyltransferase [Spirochaetia bacterium]|nr:ATP phosphoribosyltransferase [Spirochaetia bacterium]
MDHTLKIALPKGRMSEESIEFFYNQNISSLKNVSENRQLIFNDEVKKIQYLLIRSKDVGTYVEQGAADIGVIGYDLLLENSFDVFVPASLPFGNCRLSVAHPEKFNNWKKMKKLRVATKYPKITSKYFFEKGINIQMINLYGSIELAPLTDISDVIVDLVSTGQTLKAHNLYESDVILESNAQIILNSSSYVFHKKRITNILNKILNVSLSTNAKNN